MARRYRGIHGTRLARSDREANYERVERNARNVLAARNVIAEATRRFNESRVMNSTNPHEDRPQYVCSDCGGSGKTIRADGMEQICLECDGKGK